MRRVRMDFSEGESEVENHFEVEKKKKEYFQPYYIQDSFNPKQQFSTDLNGFPSPVSPNGQVQFAKRLVLVQNVHFLSHFMQTSMKYSSENPNGLQARKQEVGKLLSYDTENATTDNCSKSFTDRICNCGSTSKKKKIQKVI